MEATSGERGILELKSEGTPVEYCEGDGDTTLLSRLKTNQGIDMKKRFDKNHVMKNTGKSLYALQAEKGVKLSKTVIAHLQKCISYALSTNSGDEDGLKENLEAIIPHNFGDHQLCKPRFCQKVRNPDIKYIHRSLPYKHNLSGEKLRSRLDDIMASVIARVGQLVDLGSSQQCEHANREVTLRAPKNIHYGGTEALDFRVHATSAFINEGRHYIAKVCLVEYTVTVAFFLFLFFFVLVYHKILQLYFFFIFKFIKYEFISRIIVLGVQPSYYYRKL